MSRTDRLTRTSLAVWLLILALTGCQGITGSPNTAQIRVINASPDSPMLDVYQGRSALAYNLTFGTITSYVPVPSGTTDLSSNPTGSRDTIAATRESLAPGQYTFLVGNTAPGLQQILLKDQSTPAPTGQVTLRFVDQVTAWDAFDIYLVPSGTPVTAVPPFLTNQSYNDNSGYLNLPSGHYRIVLYPSGAVPSAAVPAAYSGTIVTYPSGAVKTIILLDQKVPLRPAIQLIIATDVDPTPKPG